VTIGDYKQYYTAYWLLCAPTGSTFRSSVVIARTIHEFCISPSTNCWGRFMPRRKVGNTGTKHVCGYANWYLSFKSSVVSLKKGIEFPYTICAILNAVTVSRFSHWPPAFRHGGQASIPGYPLLLHVYLCQYHSTNDPYSSSSFFWFCFVSFVYGCMFCIVYTVVCLVSLYIWLYVLYHCIYGCMFCIVVYMVVCFVSLYIWLYVLYRCIYGCMFCIVYTVVCFVSLYIWLYVLYHCIYGCMFCIVVYMVVCFA